MNDKLKEILANIFAYSIIGYIFISWLFAILLLIYNFMLVPIAKANIPIDTYIMQQLNSLNMSSLGYNLNLEIQILKSYTPIPTNQLIKDELALILPPAILGLIYYSSKKENHDE
jgi:hypothetical protein